MSFPGQPAASFAAIRGDGERGELLGGRTTASVCGQSSSEKQQGDDFVKLLLQIYMCNTVRHGWWQQGVRYFPQSYQRGTDLLYHGTISMYVPLHEITLPPSGVHLNGFSKLLLNAKIKEYGVILEMCMNDFYFKVIKDHLLDNIMSCLISSLFWVGFL